MRCNLSACVFEDIKFQQSTFLTLHKLPFIASKYSTSIEKQAKLTTYYIKLATGRSLVMKTMNNHGVTGRTYVTNMFEAFSGMNKKQLVALSNPSLRDQSQHSILTLNFQSLRGSQLVAN